MEISWYGLSCFRLRERGINIVCDPYSREATGLQLPRLRADIVTISHDRPGHNHARAVGGDPKVLQGPGDYEVKGVFITGLATYHATPNGATPERNVAFFFDFEGFVVGHLGDLGQIPSQSQVEDLGEIDVLLVPVGGGKTLDATRAAEVISLLEPKIVIPMHYQHPGLDAGLTEQLDTVDKFLRELGVSEAATQDNFKAAPGSLSSEETQVILLKPAAD